MTTPNDTKQEYQEETFSARFSFLNLNLFDFSIAAKSQNARKMIYIAALVILFLLSVLAYYGPEMVEMIRSV